MADVNVTPRIRCDNCGQMADKETGGYGSKTFARPRAWGSARIEGSRSSDSYGGKSRVDYGDLCPACAQAAYEAAAEALKLQRGESE